MADTVLAGDGDGIIAIFASNADFAIDTVSSSCSIWTGDGNARLAVFAILTGNEEAIFAIITVCTIMADDDGRAALGLNSDFAVLAIFASLTIRAILANSQLVVELDVVGHQAVAVSFGSNHQVAIVGIVFAISIGPRISDGRFRLVIDRDHGTLAGSCGGISDGFADFGQLIFRSRPAADIIRTVHIPILVVQTDGIAAINRMVALVGGQFRIGKLANLGISRLQGTIIQIYMFGQPDVKLAIIIFCHTDIGIRQFSLGFAHDIQPFIELLVDNFCIIILAVIAGEFQAVIQGGYGMGILPIGAVLAVLVDNTGDVRAVHARFAILAISTGLAFFRADEGGSDAISTVFPVDADVPILAVFPGFAFLAYHHAVRGNILVHQDVDGRGAIISLFYGSQQVLAGVFIQFFRAGTLDVDGAVQFIAHRIGCLTSHRRVGPEFQTVIQGCHGMGRSAGFTVLIDDTGNAVGAVDTRRTILAIGAILSDGLDDGGHCAVSAVLTSDADLAIFAILAADRHRVGRQVLIHLDGDIAVGVDFGGQVIFAVDMAIFSCNALDSYSIAQLGIIGIAGVGCKIKAFVHFFLRSQAGERDGLLRCFCAVGILHSERQITIIINSVLSVLAGRVLHETHIRLHDLIQIDIESRAVVLRHGQFFAIIGHFAPGDIVIVEIGNRALEAIGTSERGRALAVFTIGSIAAGNVFIAGYGTLLDIFSNLFELVFRSRPAALDLAAVPGRILQPRDVVARARVGAGTAGLFADGDAAGIAARSVLIACYVNRRKAHIITRCYRDIIAAAGDGDVLPLLEVDLLTGGRHILLLAIVDIQFPAGIDRVRYRLELVFRSRPAADDTVGIGIPVGIGQARNKGAVFRLGGIAIFLGSGNASLIADGHAADAALAVAAIKADFITSRNSAFCTVDGDFLAGIAAQCDAVIELDRVLAAGRMVIVGDGDVRIAGELGCLRGAVGNILHIADIRPVGGDIVLVSDLINTTAHIGDLIATKGNLIPVDDHILGFICFIVGDGNAAVILDGLAGGDGVQVFQVLGQLHRQGVGAVGDHADIAIGQFILFRHAAVDGGLLVHGPGKAGVVQCAIGLDIAGVDLAVIQGSQVMTEPLGILVPQPGRLGFIIGRSDVLTVRQGLVSIMDAGVRLGRFAVIIFLIRIACIDHIAGGHGSKGGLFIHKDGDVAVFGNAGRQVGRVVAVVIRFVAGLDGNGIPQAAFHHFVALVVFAGVGSILGVGGKAQAFGNGVGIIGDLVLVVFDVGGITAHLIGDDSQFIFRSGPSAHIGRVFNGPFFVGQPCHKFPAFGMDSSGLSVLDRIQHPIGMVTDFGCAGRDRIEAREVFIQFEFQLAIVSILAGNHADVVGSGQIVRIGLSAGDAEFLIQFHRRSSALIAAEFQPIVQGGDELGGTVVDIPIFQPAEFIVSVQIGNATADGVENIGGLFPGIVVQSHITARILADAQDHLALVVGTVVLHNRNGGPVDLHGVLHRNGFTGARLLTELGHAVHHQAAALVFFLFTQDHILAESHIIIGLTVGGLPCQFQIAALDFCIIRGGTLAAHGNGCVFSCQFADFFQLGQVHRIRILRTSCHPGDLPG